MSEGKPDSVPDPFDSRQARGSIRFLYYELTELLAVIDGSEEAGWPIPADATDPIDTELVRAARRKIRKKARDIEKRFERPKGDADGSVEDAS